MTKIVLTGAKGMLGKEIIEYITTQYPQINIVPTDIDNLDITREKDVFNYLLQEQPEMVIHCAAYTNVDKAEEERELAYKVNENGTRNIAKACKVIKAVMLYISTDFVFDGKKDESYIEEDSPSPLSIYGDSKYKGELAIREYLDQYFILRISWLYGKHGKNFVDTIIKASKNNPSLQVVDDQYGTPTHTLDVARILMPLLESQQYGIYHFSGEGRCSWNEFAKEILRMSAIEDIPVNRISTDELGRPAKRPQNSVLSKEKIKKLLRISVRPWQDSLREYLMVGDTGIEPVAPAV